MLFQFAIASLLLIKYANCSKNDFARTKKTNSLAKKYVSCFGLWRETGNRNNNVDDPRFSSNSSTTSCESFIRDNAERTRYYDTDEEHSGSVIANAKIPALERRSDATASRRDRRDSENFDTSIPSGSGSRPNQHSRNIVDSNQNKRIPDTSARSRRYRHSKNVGDSDPIERVPKYPNEASKGRSQRGRRSKNFGDLIPTERSPDTGSGSRRNRNIKNNTERKTAGKNNGARTKADKSNYEATAGKNGVKTPPSDKPGVSGEPAKAYKSHHAKNFPDRPPPVKVELFEDAHCVPDSHEDFYAQSLLYMSYYCAYDNPPFPEYEIMEGIARLFNPIVGKCEIIDLKPGNYQIDTMTINSLKNYKKKRESAKTRLAKSTNKRVLRGISYYGRGGNYKVEIYALPVLARKEQFPRHYILAYRSESDKGADYFVIQPLGYLQSHRQNGKVYLHHCENLSNYLKRSDKAFWSYSSLNNG